MYKTSPFVDCIMCMYSWQKAAYYQIKSINQLFMYISVYLFEISLCTYHDCDIHVFIISHILVSNIRFRPIRFFENLNLYFMETFEMSVYGNIALSVYNIDYTLIFLEYSCSLSSRLRGVRARACYCLHIGFLMKRHDQ